MVRSVSLSFSPTLRNSIHIKYDLSWGFSQVCYRLNVPPQSSYIETLTPNVMVLNDIRFEEICSSTFTYAFILHFQQQMEQLERKSTC